MAEQQKNILHKQQAHDRRLSSHPDESIRQRVECLICHRRIDPTQQSALATFSCNVRAFEGEQFHVWRCPECGTIHCLEIVGLARYYSKYPFAGATLTWPFRIFYRHLSRRLTAQGFSRSHTLLDYGCGNAVFVKYLHGRGFTQCWGYDPYGPADGLGDPAILNHGPFDFILLQDVLEHVEDPRSLLSELDGLLAPGGHILIGTPNADRLDLNRPDIFLNEVHVPYHLHIYNKQAVENMARAIGWQPVRFFDRPYSDRPWFGLNNRAAKVYQQLVGGTLDAVLEPVKLARALTSPRFLFYAMVGYWLSYHSDMAILFRKDANLKSPGTGPAAKND